MSANRANATPPPGVDTVRWIDERAGASPFLTRALRYVFPDHWSFMLGEIALYAFVVLVGTGTFLALFFESTTADTVYRGSYGPLFGERMSLAYASTLRLSQDVPAGLLMRQTHHWAALVFVAAITVHLMRVFFTAAFRKPRDVTWAVGVTLLMLAVLEGFFGYSMPDDLLSGMGLAIAYGVAMSIPVIGGNLAFLVWGGEYPGTHEFTTRMLTLHVFVLPALIGLLIAVHLAGVIRTHHADFRGPGRSKDNVVGTPMWPAYALRSLGLLCATAAVLFLLGGLVQINPIWQWGPYEPYLATNGAQPDWFLGWLIGGLRIMPPFGDPLLGAHVDPESILGRRVLPARRLRRAVRDPVARPAADARLPPARAARPPARQPAAHSARDGLLRVGRARLLRRLGRPRADPLRLPLRIADLGRALRRVRRAAARLPRDAAHLPRAAAQRGAPAARLERAAPRADAGGGLRRLHPDRKGGQMTAVGQRAPVVDAAVRERWRSTPPRSTVSGASRARRCTRSARWGCSASRCRLRTAVPVRA